MKHKSDFIKMYQIIGIFPSLDIGQYLRSLLRAVRRDSEITQFLLIFENKMKYTFFRNGRSATKCRKFLLFLLLIAQLSVEIL